MLYLTELDNEDKPTGLQRSMTTINVPPDARDRIRAATTTNGNSDVNEGINGAAVGVAAAAVSIAGPTRGLSIRKPGMDGALSPPPPAGPSSVTGSRRVTDFYDNYLDSYGADDVPPPPPPNKAGVGAAVGAGAGAVVAGGAAGAVVDKVANWRTNTAAGSPQGGGMPQRSRSLAQGPMSSYSGGSMRRRPTRRGTVRGPASRAPSSYTYEEEDEDGYLSADYDDGFIFEMTKIRVKVGVLFFLLAGMIHAYVLVFGGSELTPLVLCVPLCRFITRTMFGEWRLHLTSRSKSFWTELRASLGSRLRGSGSSSKTRTVGRCRCAMRWTMSWLLRLHERVQRASLRDGWRCGVWMYEGDIFFKNFIYIFCVVCALLGAGYVTRCMLC